jgi:hypothetical protein
VRQAADGADRTADWMTSARVAERLSCTLPFGLVTVRMSVLAGGVAMREPMEKR